MIDSQLSPTCQQGQAVLSPQDAMRAHVAKAISDADRYPGKPAAWLGSEYEDLADAAIAAVYAALLEYKIPKLTAWEAHARASQIIFAGCSEERVSKAWQIIIKELIATRSLANQGGGQS